MKIDQKRAHNIAQSLMLPERGLQAEVNLAFGKMITTDESRELCRKALAAARKAVEDTLAGKRNKETYKPVKARVMSICRNRNNETIADMLSIEDEVQIPCRDNQIITIYVK